MTDSTAASSPLINGANATVAANVRAQLGRYRQQQADLARALNVSAMYLSRRMNSSPAFDVHEVVAIANYFGIEPGELFEPVPKKDLQITNRSLATVTELRPNTSTVERTTLATVSNFPVAR